MNRRWLGLLLVTAVMITGLIVARAAGPGIAGDARPEPTPGPPTVGDCVLVATSMSLTLNDFNQHLVDGPLPTLETGPCDGEHYGEVTLVVSDLPAPPAGFGAPAEAVDRCLSAGVEYVGSSTPLTAEPTWHDVLLSFSAFAGPDPRQQAAGQYWVACIVRPAHQFEDGAPAYTGTLRNAASTGALRDSTGFCALDAVLQDQVMCDLPHRGETFAVANTVEPSTRTAWLATCRDRVVVLTGLTDPTAGGQLEVALVVRDDLTGEFVGDEQIPPGAQLRCGVVATEASRSLAGSLRAIGAAPLPWN